MNSNLKAVGVQLTTLSLLLIVVVFLAQFASGQYPFHMSNPPRGLVRYGLQFMPSISTDVFTKTTHVDWIFLHNTSGAAVTVTIKDRSTDCNSAACNLLTATSISAGQTWTMHCPGGVRMREGINVVASATNAIVTEIRGVQ